MTGGNLSAKGKVLTNQITACKMRFHYQYAGRNIVPFIKFLSA